MRIGWRKKKTSPLLPFMQQIEQNLARLHSILEADIAAGSAAEPKKEWLESLVRCEVNIVTFKDRISRLMPARNACQARVIEKKILEKAEEILQILCSNRSFFSFISSQLEPATKELCALGEDYAFV